MKKVKLLRQCFEQPASLRPVGVAAAQLRVGPVPNINCPGKRASPYLALFLQGKEFNLAAIPPHICQEESRQKCSGHPGSGPLARWRRLCQSSLQGIKTIALAAPPRCQPQTAPGSAVRALTSPESFDSALLWAVPAQAPESVCPHTLPVFVGGREPEVSRPWSRQSQSAPHLQTLSEATLHSLRSFRALWRWQTHRRRTRPPPQPSRLRDCQHHRPAQTLPLQRPRHIDRHLSPGRSGKGINIYSEGQRRQPLQAL